MTGTALGARDITLGGIALSIIADPDSPDKEQAAGYAGQFVTQDMTQALTRDDVPIKLRRFSQGFGIVRRRDGNDDGGYAWLENGLGWLGNGLRPAGRLQVNSTNTIANGGSVLGSVQIGTDTYLCTPRCLLRFANSDPSATPTIEPLAADGFHVSGGFRSGYQALSIALWQTGTGDPSGVGLPCIVVGTFNGTTGDSRMYRYIPSTDNWRESAVLGMRCYKLETVYWTDEGGTGAERLVIATADNILRHVIRGTDALDPTQWVTPIDVGTTVYDFKGLAATPQHIWALKQDGIWDIGPLRAANVTPYWKDRPASQTAIDAKVYGDYLYVARDFTLDRYPVSQDGIQQRVPSECAPAFGTQDGHPCRGYNTALAVHEGGLLDAVYNPDLKTTYVMRGFPKQSWKGGSENPLEWHGAEAVIEPVAGVGFQCTHLRVGSPAVAGGSALPALATYLWICVVASATPGNIDIWYQPLPTSAGPVSLALNAGGSFASNPTADYILTGQDWDDDNADKYIRRSDMRSQLASATRTHALYSRTDAADPTTITQIGTWTLEGTATANSAKILPTPPTSGKTIWYRVRATTPSPYTTAPIFQSLSPRAAVVRETYEKQTLYVLLERGVDLRNGVPDVRNPDSIAASVVALSNTGYQTYIDPKGNSYTVLVGQDISFVRTHVEGRDWRWVMRLSVSKVA